MSNYLNKYPISIIIPVLNEKQNLINLTNKIYKNTKGLKLEIIFVDDNSDDGSDKVLKFLQKKNKNFRYFIRKQNRDLTQSCFYGIQKSKYKIILIMDGDGQHNPKYIKKMLSILSSKKVDFVVGARKFKNMNESLSFFRFYASKILIFLFNILFKLKTSDPMTGYFIFRREFYYKYKKYFFGKGYKILADLIYSTPKQLKIIDYKIEFLKRHNEKSKMNLKVLLILIKFIIYKAIKLNK